MKNLRSLISLFAVLVFNSSVVQADSAQLNVTESVIINATPDKVWSLLGDYNALDQWHPAIIKSELTGTGTDKGDIRVLTLGDGGLVYDELIAYEKDKMSYTYKVNKAPIPVAEYVGSLMVEHSENGISKVTWECDFVADGVSEEEAINIISGIYKTGLNALRERY